MTIAVNSPLQLPPALLEGNTFTGVDIAQTNERDQGELRRRVVYTKVPQHVTVQWLLDQYHYDIFFQWYELELNAGQRTFDLPIVAQGVTGLARGAKTVWWEAQFKEPYSTDVVVSANKPIYIQDEGQGFLYKIVGKMILYGIPLYDRPIIPFSAKGTNKAYGGAFIQAAELSATGTNTADGGWVA